MRFGIMAMQLKALIPPNLSGGDIFTHLLGFDHVALVRRLASFGFSPIELGGDMPTFLPHTFDAATVEVLADLKSELELSYTLHLPLWSVEASTPLTPVRLGSVKAITDSIRMAAPLHPEVYVLHATGALAAEFYRMRMPEAARAVVLRQFQNGAKASLEAVLEETAIPSRQLAIETIEFPFEMTLELAEALDLSICFDTGHVLAGFSGPVDFFEALEACLPRLAEVHLHDAPWQGDGRAIGYGKDHQVLGAGDLEAGRFLDRLAAAGFSGPLIFELQVEEALASMQVVQSLRPELVDGGRGGARRRWGREAEGRR